MLSALCGLQDLCLQTVAANFAVSPSLAYLPEAHLSKLISLLSLELPLELAGTVCALNSPVGVDVSASSLHTYDMVVAGNRQRGILETSSQQYMEQLPGKADVLSD